MKSQVSKSWEPRHTSNLQMKGNSFPRFKVLLEFLDYLWGDTLENSDKSRDPILQPPGRGVSTLPCPPPTSASRHEPTKKLGGSGFIGDEIHFIGAIYWAIYMFWLLLGNLLFFFYMGNDTNRTTTFEADFISFGGLGMPAGISMVLRKWIS